MIEQLPSTSPAILGFKLQGKLHDRDYQTFVPTLEAAIAAHGKIRMLAQFEDFHGWDLHALWDDFQFGIQHCSDLERIAIVGDHKWEEWMTKLCKPFTKASVNYFDASQLNVAWAWLREAA